MQIENQPEKYAERINVKVRIDPDISPIKNAIFVSKSFADSMTIYKTHHFTAKARKTQYGPEQFTKDIPNVREEQTRHLNDDGIVSLNTFVSDGDIIIGEVSPKGDNNLTPEDRVLLAIFGEKASPTMDISTHIPKNISGVVTDIKIETRKDNPKMEKYCYEIVTVSVRQSLPLIVGDIIVDNKGNKGIVVGYTGNDEGNDYHITANFNFDGSKVIRDSSIMEVQAARGTGNYNCFGKPFARGLFDDPQKLCLTHLIKIIKSGHLKDLIYLVVGNADYKVRSEMYDRIVRGMDLPDNHINVQFISRIMFLLHGMGVKCIFRSGGNIIDNPKDMFKIGIDKIINAEDLEVSFAPLTDKDILNYSYGEVKSPESLNFRKDQPDPKGIYSQQIFGTIKDWECACGKYKRIRYNGTICEECGVEVASSSVRTQRMGHLSFPIELDNYIFNDIKHTKALVIPPAYRPFINIGYNQYAVSDLNNLYKSVISRSNRLTRLNELSALSMMIESEQKLLAETYSNLFFGINGKYKCNGYVDYLFNNIQDSIVEMMLDYSATTRAITGNNIKQGYIGIPLNIALSIYSPYIIRELVKSGKTHSAKTAITAVKNLSFNDNDKVSFVECITNIFNDGVMPNILLVSDGEEGEALSLAPIITDKPAFELNEQDYTRLNVLDPSEPVKAFLPPINNAVNTNELASDNQINAIKLFAERIEQLATLSKEDRDKNIIALIRNTQEIDVNSFVFCYLTGRGFLPSERQEALSHLEFEDVDSDINKVLMPKTYSLEELESLFNDDDENPFDDIDGDDEE